MAEEQFSVPVGTHSITVIRHPPDKTPAAWVLTYAPGAGSGIHDPFGVFLCRQLAAAGTTAYRFQFPYMEEKRRAPDRAAVLLGAWRAVIEEIRTHMAESSGPRDHAQRLAIGGRSMGGRYASMVAAEDGGVDALVLFAYPLHAPGDPRWRDVHLPRIAAPTLFCSGTNDTFAAPEELRAAAGRVPTNAVRLLDGADHGFGVRKDSGRSRGAVYAEAVEALLTWLGAL